MMLNQATQSNQATPPERSPYSRTNEAHAYLGIGRSTFLDLVAKGLLPGPQKFGPRVSLWKTGPLLAAWETLLAARAANPSSFKKGAAP